MKIHGFMLVGFVLLGSPLHADEEASLGGRGAVAISGDFSLGATYTTSNGSGSTSLSLRPALDVFVWPHVSLGAQVGVSSIWLDGASEYAYSIEPRIGYDVRLGGRVHFWPRLGFLWERVAPGDMHVDTTAVDLFAPLTFAPAPHFFIGIGPRASHVMSDAGNTTQVGLQSIVGGWF